MSIWLTIILAGLFTYAIRLSFILLYGRIEMSVRMQAALRFVPPSVLTAIILPELLVPEGSLNLSLGNARLLAGVLAMVVAWRTKNVVLTIVIGMFALWLLQTLIG